MSGEAGGAGETEGAVRARAAGAREEESHGQPAARVHRQPAPGQQVGHNHGFRGLKYSYLVSL